jgi:hypothetical protein
MALHADRRTMTEQLPLPPTLGWMIEPHALGDPAPGEAQPFDEEARP